MERVVVFCISRTGSSSLEVALQILGYKTLHAHVGRNKTKEKLKNHSQLMNNIKNKKPLFENLSQNGFILGYCYKNNINEMIKKYPDTKIIVTDRNDDDWIRSYKNHTIRANRPNPKRNTLSKLKIDFIDNIKNQINQTEKEYPNIKNNFLILSVNESNKWEILCKFLGKKKPNKEYPSISTGLKLKLTKAQLDY